MLYANKQPSLDYFSNQAGVFADPARTETRWMLGDGGHQFLIDQVASWHSVEHLTLRFHESLRVSYSKLTNCGRVYAHCCQYVLSKQVAPTRMRDSRSPFPAARDSNIFSMTQANEFRAKLEEDNSLSL